MPKREPDLYERELERYRETLRLDSEVAAGRYGLTLVNSLNPAERALALRDMGMEVSDAVDYYNLGCHAASEENWSEAIIHFKRAAEKDPELTDAIHNLAICYENTGHIPQAKSTWAVYTSSISDEDEIADVQAHLAEL